MLYEPFLYGLIPERDTPFTLSVVNFGCKYHWHDHIEILYIKEGQCTATIEGRTYKMSPDILLLIGPKEQHNTYNYSENASWFVLQIHPNVISPECMSYTVAKYIRPFLEGVTAIRHEIHEVECPDVFDTFRQIISACEEKQLGFEIFAYAKINELFSRLIRNKCI